MKQLTRMLCRLLIVLMAWTPFQLSHAGMIGTNEQVAITSQAADRATVLSLINRADISKELTAFGVNPGDAVGRIAAMSDEEVATLKAQLETAPAGADGGIVILVLVGVILWLVFWKNA
ncbi:MAG TPA: PA2779 family protein [Burkholderiales bacterium]|nr:PA2779 family protein [Burkholderiales bacterium]